MGALGTSQRHLPSGLDEYRTTSEQGERGSQAVTFIIIFPLGTVRYKARFTNALSLYNLNYQLYISGTIVLHIKCAGTKGRTGVSKMT
jgi:hypothetical protein